MNIAVDLSSRRNNRIQRHPEQFGKRGKQIHTVKGGTKHRHNNRTRHAGHNSPLLCLPEQINHGRGQHQRAADHKVCQIPDKSGACSLNHQLQQDLTKLNHHARHRTEGKSAYQCRNLGKIKLIESRR